MDSKVRELRMELNDEQNQELQNKREASREAMGEGDSLEDLGDISIANEVICIVAALAAQEIHGVVSTAGNVLDAISTMMGRDSNSKGVRLKFEGHVVDISIYLNIEFGFCIPEIAMLVQEKVKSAVEDMTGYEVRFVDVHIEGVQYHKLSELEKEAEKDEYMRELVKQQAKAADATTATSYEMQLKSLEEDK